MSRPLALNTLVVATSIRPLFTSTAALRRLAYTPSLATVNNSTSRPFSTTIPTRFAKTTSKMTVHVLSGQDEYGSKITKAGHSKLIVLDCFATWCGPCKAIAPKLVQWSNEEELSDVEFYKIDVDESAKLAQELGVRAMPTFYFYKNGEKIDELVGADPAKLRSMIQSHK